MDHDSALNENKEICQVYISKWCFNSYSSITSSSFTKFFNDCVCIVVILNSCRDHLSYYTALSRSSTAEGTVIIQGFNPNKITCGAPGYLRQEFRELELLDEITQLQFEDKLSPTINGHLRNSLIRQYQLFKGELYVPDVVPGTFKWSKSDPMNILKVQTDTQWQLIEKFKEKTTKYTHCWKRTILRCAESQ